MDEHERAKRVEKYGEGPWVDEPDVGAWEAHGYRCMFSRTMELGTLCGYVGVPEGHPWFGRHYDDIDRVCQPSVHGGLTYSDEKRQPSPDGFWYVGFDCGHLGDLMPFRLGVRFSDMMGMSDPQDVYRDVAYVRAETESLARQAREAATLRRQADEEQAP